MCLLLAWRVYIVVIMAMGMSEIQNENISSLLFIDNLLLSFFIKILPCIDQNSTHFPRQFDFAHHRQRGTVVVPISEGIEGEAKI